MEDRLDKILVDRGLVSSRERAKILIQGGAVLVSGKVVNKPGKFFLIDVDIQLQEQEIPWVSRGSLKLIYALEKFSVSAEGKICLDLGASTGGFTEVLLAHKALMVFAVDVGHGQLADRLKNDKRVVNLEKTHVKDLNQKLIHPTPELVVIDVSFISLEKVLPFLPPLLTTNAEILALIKPQFEVGKSNLNKQGIVRQPSLYKPVIENIQQAANSIGFATINLIDSPILGGDGNKEFLIHLRRENN